MAESPAWRDVLSARDEDVVAACLAAIPDSAPGDTGLRIRTGLTREDFRAAAAEWPATTDLHRTYAAVVSSLIELLEAPAGWPPGLAYTTAEAEDVLWRVQEASGQHDVVRSMVRRQIDELMARDEGDLHRLTSDGGSVDNVVDSARQYGVEVPARLPEFLAAWPLGPRLDRWHAPPPVPAVTLTGRYATLVPLAPQHAEELYECSTDRSVWHYLSYGPWREAACYRRWIERHAPSTDPVFLTVLVDGRPRGVVSYLCIDPPNGAVEIGHIWYAPAIQRTPATTEVTYLLAKHVFDLGYRRLEWKCHARNARSRRAAERFGFTYEGTFRQHMVVKDRNRDTAWFSMLDGEWPARRAAFERWLDPANFDETGRQRTPLGG